MKRDVLTRICMQQEDDFDLFAFTFVVPEDVTDDAVFAKLTQIFYNESDACHMDAVAFVEYVCKKTGWEWKPINFAIDINLGE